jgi:hypothetical protein
MSNDYEIFQGKSLSALFKDIYDNSKRNKTQIEILVKEVGGFIKDGDMAVQLIPMIREYLDINVKNDELLVKLASIVQRLIQAENKSTSSDDLSLSDSEKAQLLSSLDETVLELQKKSDNILDDIDTIGN